MEVMEFKVGFYGMDKNLWTEMSEKIGKGLVSTIYVTDKVQSQNIAGSVFLEKIIKHSVRGLHYIKFLSQFVADVFLL